jgi:hypothetical protein
VNVVVLVLSSWWRDVMSDTAGTSSIAAARGRMDLAEEECAETTCVKGVSLERRDSRRGETDSGRGGEYCGEME